MGVSRQTNTVIPLLSYKCEREQYSWMKKVSKKCLVIIYSVINKTLGITEER